MGLGHGPYRAGLCAHMACVGAVRVAVWAAEDKENLATEPGCYRYGRNHVVTSEETVAQKTR